MRFGEKLAPAVPGARHPLPPAKRFDERGPYVACSLSRTRFVLQLAPARNERDRISLTFNKPLSRCTRIVDRGPAKLRRGPASLAPKAPQHGTPDLGSDGDDRGRGLTVYGGTPRWPNMSTGPDTPHSLMLGRSCEMLSRHPTFCPGAGAVSPSEKAALPPFWSLRGSHPTRGSASGPRIAIRTSNR
jgi:hypothetical protein